MPGIAASGAALTAASSPGARASPSGPNVMKIVSLNKIITSPIYPSVTIRSWNTTTKLLSMMG
jgi:hypothetical protein